MKKQQCKDGLEIYKRYLVRMEKIQAFLKVAENVSQTRFNTAYMVRGTCRLSNITFGLSRVPLVFKLRGVKTFWERQKSKNSIQVGIDKGDMPDLTSAPSSLLEALQDHLNSLEG